MYAVDNYTTTESVKTREPQRYYCLAATKKEVIRLSCYGLHKYTQHKNKGGGVVNQTECVN